MSWFFSQPSKCELPKLTVRHNIGPISAGNSRLLLFSQCRRLHRSNAGPTTVAFVDCLNLANLIRNLAQYRPYAKPIVTFTMASSSESRRARVRPTDGTLLRHVWKPKFGTGLARCCAENYQNSLALYMVPSSVILFCS